MGCKHATIILFLLFLINLLFTGCNQPSSDGGELLPEAPTIEEPVEEEEDPVEEEPEPGPEPEPEPEPEEDPEDEDLLTVPDLEACQLIKDWSEGEDLFLQFTDNVNNQNGWWEFDHTGVTNRYYNVGGGTSSGPFRSDETIMLGQCMFHIVNSLAGIDQVWFDGVELD